jgi:hypothetical protein
MDSSLDSSLPHSTPTQCPTNVGVQLRRSDTLPAEDHPAWSSPKPVAGRMPIPARNEPILYIRTPCHLGSDGTGVEEE